MDPKIELTKKLLNILETYFYNLPNDVAVLMIDNEHVTMPMYTNKELRSLLAKPDTEDPKFEFLPIVASYIMAHEAIYGEKYFKVKFTIGDESIMITDTDRLDDVLSKEFEDDSYIEHIGSDKSANKELTKEFDRWFLNEIKLVFPKKTSAKKSSKKEENEVKEVNNTADFASEVTKIIAETFGCDIKDIAAYSIDLSKLDNVPTDEEEKKAFIAKNIKNFINKLDEKVDNEESSKEENKEFFKTSPVGKEYNSCNDCEDIHPAPCNHECDHEECECSECEECPCEEEYGTSDRTIKIVVNVPINQIGKFIDLVQDEFNFNIEMSINDDDYIE